MDNNHYDIIIIGAGLSGLYSAYNIKKISPKTKILLLESNRQPYIGGRIGNYNFFNTNIVVGAGVGREDTDYLLIDLLDELKIKYKPFKVAMHYSKEINDPINVKDYLTKLRLIYRKYNKKPNETFKEFGIKNLGEEEYKKFVVSAGYSDYENEDVFEVLYHYQMEDNSPGWTALEIHWDTLVNKLCKKIGYENILTSNKVESILKLSHQPCLFEINSLVNKKRIKKYLTNKIIVATRINTLQKLFPKLKIYNEIHGQPFLYIYAKFDSTSSKIMEQLVPTYTIVPGPLQKMIPFSKSVYMIAYSDNNSAIKLQKYKENTIENRSYFAKEVEKSLGLIPNSLKILSIKDFYWPIGTHYYEPLDLNLYKSRPDFIKKAQHPEAGILVVGEAVSRRQGWTEGALESVRSVLNKDWIYKNNC